MYIAIKCKGNIFHTKQNGSLDLFTSCVLISHAFRISLLKFIDSMNEWHIRIAIQRQMILIYHHLE